jgi:hypothetical protein
MFSKLPKDFHSIPAALPRMKHKKTTPIIYPQDAKITLIAFSNIDKTQKQGYSIILADI